MSRPANTRYCNSDCKRLAFEERQAKKAKRRRGKRADTSYAVWAVVHGAEVQTLRLVGITAANRREEAAEKLREYAPGDDLVPIPTRSIEPVAAALK